MFIILNGTQVILGPLPWKKRRFEECLSDDLEISYTLPVTNTDAIVINENVKILPVKNINYEPINQKIQCHNGPFYDIYTDYVDVYYTATDLNLDIAKQRLKETLADLRWQLETRGITLTIQNTEIFVITERGERDIFLQALQLGNDNAVWKFNNVWLTLSLNDLTTIVTGIATHVQSAFTWEANLVTSINNATTLTELDAISLNYA